jgi:predicted aspartyl protease
MAYRDDLEAAIRRAEDAERKLAQACYLHPEAKAASVCATCARGICEACTMAALEGNYCPSCFGRMRGSQLRRQTAILVVSGTALTAAAVLIVTLLSRSDAVDAPVPPRHDSYDYSKHTVKIARLTEQLAKDPCNRSLTLQLADTYNLDSDYSKTVALVDDFGKRCGPWPRLLWPAVGAHERRAEWQPAVELATVLIENEPTDPDFWWWRGRDLAEQGRLVEAAADLHASMGARPNGFAAGLLGKGAQKLGRPCEGAFAYRLLIEASGEADDDDAARGRGADLYRAGRCEAMEGQGTATLRLKPNTELYEAKVTIGKATGAFVIDEHAGYLTVTKAFAEQAGLAAAAGKTEVTVYAAGATRNAHLALATEVRMGETRAPQVDVAVVDGLPPRTDGVVGLSFLWRFQMTYDAAKLRIGPHHEEAAEGDDTAGSVPAPPTGAGGIETAPQQADPGSTR